MSEVTFPIVGNGGAALATVRCDRLCTTTYAPGKALVLARDEREVERILADARDEEAGGAEIGIPIWVRFIPRDFGGRSYGLALAIADKQVRYEVGDGGSYRRVFASGIVLENGSGRIGEVEGLGDKLDVIAAEAGTGDLVVFPNANLADPDARTRERLDALSTKGVTWKAIDHLREIDRLWRSAATVAASPMDRETASKSLGPNPYRGLEAFRLEDADRFFGRDELVDRLWRHFASLHRRGEENDRSARFFAIFGASGSGKSSVAQAGLLAEFRRRPLTELIDPTVIIFSPEARPMESLALALARPGFHEPAPVARASELKRRLQSNDGRSSLDRIAGELPIDGPLILLVDQFEETFSLCDDANERRAFIDTLLDAARVPDGRVSVIVTLRSDFLGAVNDHIALGNLIATQHEVVPVMHEDELREAIVAPAREAGHELDRAVVDLLIEQSAGQHGSLPLLQFALTRIWEGLVAGRSEQETLRDIKGVGGAVANEAEALFSRLDEDDRATARRAFLAMVRLGEGTRDTRRRASVAEIVAAGERREDVERVLGVFADPRRRLVTMAGTETGDQTVEVSHEALIDEWARLRDWLDGGRDNLRFRRRLFEAARLWKDGQGGVWRPPELDLLRAYHRDHGKDLTEDEMQFFAASEREMAAIARLRAEEEAARQRLERERQEVELNAAKEREQAAIEREKTARRIAKVTRIDAALMTILAIVAVVGGYLAYDRSLRADREAERAKIGDSLYRAEQARKLLDDHRPVPAMHLALAGLPKDPSEPDRPWVGETAGALVESLERLDEIAIPNGHGADVMTLALSSDGRRIFSGSIDRTLRIWDLESGASVDALTGHRGGILSIAESRDGRRLVTGSRDNSIGVWDGKSGVLEGFLEGHGQDVFSVAVSSDGAMIVSGSKDNTVRLWDAESGATTRILEGHAKSVYAVALSDDASRIASGSRDGTVRIWDATNGKALHAFSGHDDDVSAVMFSRDTRQAISGSRDGTIRIWDLASGRQERVLVGHDDDVLSMALSGDGARLASASRDGTIRVWSLSDGRLRHVLKGHAGPAFAVSMTLSGDRLVSGSGDNTIRIWNIGDNERRRALRGHRRAISALAFSAESQTIVSGSLDGTVRIWTIDGSTAERVLEGHDGPVLSVAISDDGRRIASGSADRTVRLWDRGDGKETLALKGHEGDVFSVAITGDGRHVISGSADRTIRLWDAVSGREIDVLRGHQGAVHSVARSPDDAYLVSGSRDDTVRIWDLGEQTQLDVLDEQKWPVFSAVFSPDGRWIASGAGDGTVRIWNASEKTLLRTLKGYAGAISTVRFSPNGRRLLAVAENGTIQIWDMDGDMQFELVNPCAPQGTPAVGAIGDRHVVRGCSDDIVGITWLGADDRTLIERARDLLPRDLTDFEKRQFHLATE